MKTNRWIFLLIITGTGFFLDWLSKHIISSNFYLGETKKIFGSYLELMYVRNRGALFGFNPGTYIPDFPVNLFFYIVSSIAIAMLLIYYGHLKDKGLLLNAGVSLVLPGALGNLFDRIMFPDQGVVDFIKVGISERLYWPIFNFADAYITVGIILILIDYYQEEKRNKTAVSSEKRSDTAAAAKNPSSS